MPLYFYTVNDPHGCFSNFSPHGFFLEGYQWKTAEHYFQAQKFIHTPQFDKIRLAKTAKEAARLGKERTFKIREDWDTVKDEIMFKGVLEKFKKHADIREILLNTNDEELIENSPYDYYWGCGADGSGQNKLGKILMKVRVILHEAKK